MSTTLPPEESLDKSGSSEKFWKLCGLSLWLISMVTITVMVAKDPLHRSVVISYHKAYIEWHSHEPMEVMYLPQFCILFAPFHALPSPVGDILWRWLGAVGLIWGLQALLRATFPKSGWRAFALVSLPTLFLMLGAIRNGQANAHIAAALLLGAVFLVKKRWAWAALFLMLAVAIKPLGLAAAGLAFAAFAATRWRIVAGIFLLALLPLLFDPPAQVKNDMVSALTRLQKCEEVSQQRFVTKSDSLTALNDSFEFSSVAINRFADINGLLGPLGIPLTGRLATLAKVLAGGFLFMLLFLAGRRKELSLPTTVMLWYTASVFYLMLFNPMTETNSYVIIAPVIGWWIWLFIQIKEIRMGWILIAVLLSMSLLRNILAPFIGSSPSNAFANAWLPAMTLAFAAIVIGKWNVWSRFQSSDKH